MLSRNSGMYKDMRASGGLADGVYPISYSFDVGKELKELNYTVDARPSRMSSSVSVAKKAHPRVSGTIAYLHRPADLTIVYWNRLLCFANSPSDRTIFNRYFFVR